MNKNTLSNKSVFLIAAMLLSGMMLATSSVPTRAFAQVDIPDVEALLTQASPDSTSEEDTSGSEVGDNNVIPTDSTSEEDTSGSEVGDNNVIVDPITNTAVEADTNVNTDTHVITDPEDCEEANDEVNQANAQSAGQQEGRSDGEVGDNGVFVSPKTQTATEFALNLNVDTDIILVDGCNTPSDELHQANAQSADQRTGSDVEAGSGSTVKIPSTQRVDAIARNIGIDNNVMQPVM